MKNVILFMKLFIKSDKNFETINKTYNRKIERLEKELKKMKNILMIMKKIELKNKEKLIN